MIEEKSQAMTGFDKTAQVYWH